MSKTILITGASGAIGAATARRLDSDESHLILHYRSRKANVSALKDDLIAGGAARVTLVQGDLEARDGRQQFIASVMDLTPHLDILINNAGGPVVGCQIDAVSEDLVDRIFGLNYTAPLLLCRRYFPEMVRQRSGVIVNVSSIGVKFGGGERSLIYSSAKRALEGVTVNLARAGARHGVFVNTVRAGVVASDLHLPDTDLTARAALIPTGELTKADEVASMICYLAAPDAPKVTGQTFTISGGE